MREQLTTCYGCGVVLNGPPASPGRRRWCDNGCQEVSADIKFAEHVAQRYGLPPDALLKDVANAIREQLRSGGRARERADLIALERQRREQEEADAPFRRGWSELIQELAPLSCRTWPRDRDGDIEHRGLDMIERELFGDITSRRGRRWDHLHDFARTTYKDDGANPNDLLSDARAYLKARLAEDGFTRGEEPAEDQFAWPTIGETRPGLQERP